MNYERGEVLLSEFISQYWMEALFTVICAVCAYFFKHYFKMLKTDYERQKADILKSIDTKFTSHQQELTKMLAIQKQEFTAQDAKLISDLETLKNGILSVQGRVFKEDCRKMLEDNHVITLKEYEHITNEHSVYNALGGNHEGDALYQLVVVKYQSGLTQDGIK